MDVDLHFRDEQNCRDVWFWKSPINHTMFILDDGEEGETGIILDFRCQNGSWSFENTCLFHPECGKSGECSIISDENQLPPVNGWDENTPPIYKEYLVRVHNLAQV